MGCCCRNTIWKDGLNGGGRMGAVSASPGRLLGPRAAQCRGPARPSGAGCRKSPAVAWRSATPCCAVLRGAGCQPACQLSSAQFLRERMYSARA